MFQISHLYRVFFASLVKLQFIYTCGITNTTLRQKNLYYYYYHHHLECTVKYNFFLKESSRGTWPVQHEQQKQSQTQSCVHEITHMHSLVVAVKGITWREKKSATLKFSYFFWWVKKKNLHKKVSLCQRKTTLKARL